MSLHAKEKHIDFQFIYLLIKLVTSMVISNYLIIFKNISNIYSFIMCFVIIMDQVNMKL